MQSAPGPAASCCPRRSGGTGDGALVEYFARIAASVSLPVMIQDAPAYLGVGLGPALVQRIAEAADNVRLVKLEAGPAEMSSWFDALGDDFAIWGGDGGVYLLDCLRSGAHGIIPGADLVDLLVAVYEAYASGDERTRRRTVRAGAPDARLRDAALDRPLQRMRQARPQGARSAGAHPPPTARRLAFSDLAGAARPASLETSTDARGDPCQLLTRSRES